MVIKKTQLTEKEELEMYTNKILKLKEKTANNIISIGQCLFLVKTKLPYGKFTQYLKEKVNFSKRTANKFMKVYQMYEKQLENKNSKEKSTSYFIEPEWGIEKLYALTTIKEEDRRKIINENNMKGISTRELKKKIKEIKGIKAKKKNENKKVIDVKIIETDEQPKNLNNIEKYIEFKIKNGNFEELKTLQKDLEEHIKKIKNMKEKLILTKAKKHKEISDDFEIIYKEKVVDDETFSNTKDLKYDFYIKRNDTNMLLLKDIWYFSITDFTIKDDFNEVHRGLKNVDEDIKEAVFLKVQEMKDYVKKRKEELENEKEQRFYDRFFNNNTTKNNNQQNEDDKKLLKKFYVTLCKNYHPDKIGGDGFEMKFINTKIKESWGI